MMAAVGDALLPFRIASVDPAAMAVWAELLGDPNPIHLDRAAVAAAGLGDRRINQGPANLAYVVNMLRAAFPGAQVEALDMRFVANVLEEDAVTAGGTIVAIHGGRVDCHVWLDIEGRGKALSGTATLVLRPGQD